MYNITNVGKELLIHWKKIMLTRRLGKMGITQAEAIAEMARMKMRDMIARIIGSKCTVPHIP